MATRTLYPKYKTSSTNFGGILSSNGTGEASYDIPVSGCNIGTIVFDTSPLHKLSRACVMQGYSVSYDQRCNINQWSKLYWNLTPKLVGEYRINGNEIDVRDAYTFGRNVRSDTTGDGWLSKGGAFLDSNNIGYYSTFSIFGGFLLLGFGLQGENDHSVGSYKLWMRNLRATVTYEQRYYARFWDENGNLLGAEQGLAAGVMANAPTTDNQGCPLERDGYTIAWECDQVVGNYNNIYTANGLPTSVETDLDFHILYRPINRLVCINDVAKGSFYLYKYVNNDWQMQTKWLYHRGCHYYSVQHGDRVKIVAVDVTTTQEDLVVQLSDGDGQEIASTTISGEASTTLDVFETQSITQSYIITLEAQAVNYTIITSAGTGGSITPSPSVPRGSNQTIRITPSTGYELDTYTFDGSTTAVTGTQRNGMTLQLDNVRANHTISATFSKIVIPIDLAGVPSGVTVTGPSSVNYGDSQTWVFTCGDDKSLLTTTVDGVNMMDPVRKQVKSFSVTLNNITETHALAGTVTSNLVTISINQTTGGTVSGDTGVYVKNIGTVTFTYAITDWYDFVKWFDNSTGRTVDVSTDTSASSIVVSAAFEAKTIKISATTHGEKVRYNGSSTVYYDGGIGGTVQIGSDSPGTAVNKYVSSTDTVTVKAVPSTGFVVYGFNVNGSFHAATAAEDGSATYTITEPVADQAVQAWFLRKEYVLAVPIAPAAASDDSCSVAINKKGTENTYTKYHYGSELTLTATPGEGWYFVNWSDDPSNQTPTRSITIPAANVTISAVFKKYEFDQMVEIHEGGQATIGDAPADGTMTVEYGEDLLLTITADYGQKIKDVVLDGESVFGAVTLTRRGGTLLLANITASHHIEIFFEAKTYTNNRKLLDYYPPVIKSIHEIKALMEALQVQNDAMWDAMSFVFENQFIKTATNEGVTMWERELGIIPGANDTLQQRKERLRVKWVPKNRFTMRWLTGTDKEPGWLEKVCGQPVPDPILTDYSLRVVLPSGVDWIRIFEDLKQYKPANIVLDPRVLAPRTTQKIYVGTAILVSNHGSSFVWEMNLDTELNPEGE